MQRPTSTNNGRYRDTHKTEEMNMTDKMEPAGSIGPIMKRALNFYEAGSNLAAAKIFELAYRRDSSAHEAALNMGSAYYKAKYYPEAEEAYKEVLKNAPENTDALYGLAMINEEIGDRQTAQRFFRKAAELSPSSAKMWLSLAEVTYEETLRNQALNQAVESARAQLQTSPLSFNCALLSGDVLYKAGKYSEALEAYEISLRYDSLSVKALSALSMCHLKLKNYCAAADVNREKIMRCSPQIHLAKSSQEFVESARKALIQIHTTLHEAKVQFFLVAGTLLGCIRNKAPLAHDRDVDIAIMSSVTNKAIIEALRANNEFSCPLYYTEDDTYLCVAHGNTGIDIFRHERIGNYLWSGFSRNLGDMKWRYTPFELQEKKNF